MIKKLKYILALLSLGTLAAGLAACASSESPIPDLEKQGNKIQITYDPNGGKLLESDSTKIMDLINPDDREKDENGNVTIKLTDPLDPVRQLSSNTLTKQEHFFTGWYAKRDIVKNDNGEVVNENGVVLTETDEGYVVKGTENDKDPEKSEPAYTYADLWDFEKDTLTYNASEGKKQLTLYAGWVRYYEFNYYFRDENNEWKKSDTVTTFDYKTTNAEGSETFDHDTIFLPEWNDVTVVYETPYAKAGTSYKFPKVSGTTFYKAFTDQACTQEIDGYLKHPGTLDVATAKATDRVQNVYVEVIEGERYKISTAKQLSDNGNRLGWYELSADLDFTGVTWPSAFMSNEFEGRFYSSAEGQTRTITNISATYTSKDGAYGGLFGLITASAQFKDITFKAPALHIQKVEGEDKVLVAKLGLFAGAVEEGAVFTNARLEGGMLKITSLSMPNQPELNVIACDRHGITAVGDFTLRLQSSTVVAGTYRYDIRANQVTISADGSVTYQRGTYRDTENEFIDKIFTV